MHIEDDTSPPSNVVIPDVAEAAGVVGGAAGAAVARPAVWLQVDGDVELTPPATLTYIPAQLVVRGAATIPNHEAGAGAAPP